MGTKTFYDTWTDLYDGDYKVKLTYKEVTCKFCNSKNLVRYGKYKDKQQWWCKDCQRKFAENDALPGMKTPVEQIASAIGMYYDGLSINKVRYQLKHVYGNNVSDFAVYNWLTRFTKDAIKITDNYRPNVGYVWLCDETAIKISGKPYWLLDIIDVKTRYLLATRLSKTRMVEDVQEVLKEAYQHSGIVPKVIMSDRLKSYIYAIPQTFGDKAKHLQVKKFTAKPNNNIIERMQGTIKNRIKTMRGLKTPSTARTILDGFIINYNYFRPHETLSKNKPTTPAQAAMIKFPYDSWELLIRHSQEAKSQILTKSEIPVLRELPLTKTQRLRKLSRENQRGMLADIRKQKSSIQSIRGVK